jgi:hypothetical protein
VAITPDGRRAVSGSDDETLRAWDLETGQTLTTLQGHTNWVSAVAITPDDRRAVSGSWDKTLRVWDLETGQTLTTLQGHTDSVSAVAITPDGRRAVSGSVDNTLRIWDLRDGKEVVLLTVDANVTACAVAHDNRTIVAGDSLGRVHFLRLEGLDPTKLAIGATRIQLLHREEQPTKEPQESTIMLPAQARAVFISYAHADNESQNPKERWLDRFVEFLKPLVRQEDFTLCSDQDIKIGQDWHQHIQAHLNGARQLFYSSVPRSLHQITSPIANCP